MDKEKHKMLVLSLIFLCFFLIVLICFGLYFVLKHDNTSSIPEEARQDEFAYELWNKVKDAGLTNEEFRNLLNKLRKEDGITVEVIKNTDALMVNENNITYGPDFLGAELVSVISDDGISGYVYRSDLEGSAPGSIQEALETSGKEQVLTVYESDGATVIGTFTMGNGQNK